MTKRDYTLIANTLIESKATKKVINLFIANLAETYPNFNKDFFLKYINAGIKKPVKAKKVPTKPIHKEEEEIGNIDNMLSELEKLGATL